MTDHLTAARAAIHAEHGWSMAAPASSLADMASAVAHILDHLEAAQTPDVDWKAVAGSADAVIRAGLAEMGHGPEGDPVLAVRELMQAQTVSFAQYAVAAVALDEDNHADRYDRDGDRWVWCDGCDGFRRVECHNLCRPGAGWFAVGLDEDYGPLTFAPRPADTPTTAPQPEQAHGDAPDPARPAERHTAPETYDVRLAWLGGEPIGSDADRDFCRWLDNVRAEAWEEGWRTWYADGAHCDDPHITPNPYRKDRA